MRFFLTNQTSSAIVVLYKGCIIAKDDIMIRKDPRQNAAGIIKTQVRVVESYRPGKGAPPKQRTIKDFGYLEDQSDPKAFLEMVEQFNATYKEQNVPLKIEKYATEMMYSEENNKLNYGYKYLEAVYSLLKIDEFIDEFIKEKKYRVKYSVSKIFKFLVLLRILNPDSKRATFQLKNGYYQMDSDYELEDIYRSLDKISDFETELQYHLDKTIKQTIGRDLTYAFYDVTNFYFEIDFPDEDGLRQRGVSKDHKVDPLVGFGLFMDGNGLPISMATFPGNTAESLTLKPAMTNVKKSYEVERLIVVADKGINTSNNIDTIMNTGDGYLFSQTIRGKKGKKYHESLFDEEGWKSNTDGTYWHKTFIEEYEGKDINGNKVKRRRRVLLYWNKREADMMKRKRAEKLRKAEAAVSNNAYGIKKGVDQYQKTSIVDKRTGVLLEDYKAVKSVDLEKAEYDALFDGYFCLITSELDYDEKKMREVYGSLWKIENAFRIMKSDLYARPIFLGNEEHIKAHLLTCFVSLMIIRFIQHKMGDRAISAERIARALNEANCRVLKGGIVMLDDVGGALAFKKRTNVKGEMVDTLKYTNEDEIALDYRIIQELFHTNCYNVNLKQEQFNRFIKSISL